MDSVVKLKALHKLLPKISEQLDRSDFGSLCRRLLNISNELDSSGPHSPTDIRLDETIKCLESRTAGLISHVRGVTAFSAQSSNGISQDVARLIAKEIREDLCQQLATLHQQQQDRENTWMGLPELYVFDQLPTRMKVRAAKIRDWCEDRLEFIHSRGEMRYWTAHGIGHSKRVLRFGTDLLNAFPRCFCDSFPYFAIYAGAYCHDLGMMFYEGENSDCEKTFQTVRRTHGRRTWETIMGSSDKGIPPAWRTMGFSSEREALLIANICSVHQKRFENELYRLPRSQSLFVDGETINLSPLALASILRLADGLDCNERRLPPTAYMHNRDIPNDQLLEYAKHELVENVAVGKDATIHIAMRIRYLYPQSSSIVRDIRNEISTEIDAVGTLLKSCSLTLPAFQFNTVEALFLEKHPYLPEEC